MKAARPSFRSLTPNATPPSATASSSSETVGWSVKRRPPPQSANSEFLTSLFSTDAGEHLSVMQGLGLGHWRLTTDHDDLRPRVSPILRDSHDIVSPFFRAHRAREKKKAGRLCPACKSEIGCGGQI